MLNSFVVNSTARAPKIDEFQGELKFACLQLSGRNYQMPSTTGTHDSEVQHFDTGRQSGPKVIDYSKFWSLEIC